jgi:hypothetical protein
MYSQQPEQSLLGRKIVYYHSIIAAKYHLERRPEPVGVLYSAQASLRYSTDNTLGYYGMPQVDLIQGVAALGAYDSLASTKTDFMSLFDYLMTGL